MAEHSERVRVGWIDTDAGGRIHFTVAFRWAEAAETGLYRKLGLLDEGRGDYPRRHVEADYLRVLRFDDEVEVRIRVESVGRTSITVRVGGRARRRGRDHRRPRDRACRRRRAAGRRSASASGRCSARIREPDTLAPRRTRRATGIPTPPGGRSRPDQVPDASLAYAEARAQCPVARVDGVLGGFWAVLVARPAWSTRPSTRRGSATSCRSSRRGGRRSSATRPSTPLPADAQSLLLARTDGSDRGAAPAVCGRDDRPAASRQAPATSRGTSAIRFRRGRSACCSRRPDDDWRLINDWSRRVDEVGGQSPPGSPERIAVGRGAAAVHDRADRGASPESRRRRRQRSRPRRSRAAAARRRDDRGDRDDVHLGRAQHDDERDRERGAAARPRRRSCRRASAPSPRRSRRFAEEVVRVDAPQQAMRRIATADTELGGPDDLGGRVRLARLRVGQPRPRRRSSAPPRSRRAARRTGTSASAGGSTSASARRSRGSSCGSRSRSSSPAPRRSPSTARSRDRRGRGSASTGFRSGSRDARLRSG